MGNGTGNGKIILFGEHFVVYGVPAIVAAISNKAVVEVSPSLENQIITDFKIVPELTLQGISRILKSMNINGKYNVHLTGNLPTYGGLGSSAAFCVALSRALADQNNLDLSSEEVNRHAYEGEKAYHGVPSGVDNLAATYGGVFEFLRGKTYEQNKFTSINLTNSLNFVISFSGKYSPTIEMVQKTQKFKEDSPQRFSELLEAYLKIFNEGKKALYSNNLVLLGELMNKNHLLLQELGTSDILNDQIVEIARKNYALGAKVTGGGGGGCCISLVQTEEKAKDLAEILKNSGFESFPTKI